MTLRLLSLIIALGAIGLTLPLGSAGDPPELWRVAILVAAMLLPIAAVLDRHLRPTRSSAASAFAASAGLLLGGLLVTRPIPSGLELALAIAVATLFVLHVELLAIVRRQRARQDVASEVVRVTGQGRVAIDSRQLLARQASGLLTPLAIALGLVVAAILFQGALLRLGPRMAESLDLQSVVGLALAGAIVVGTACGAGAWRRSKTGDATRAR